MKHSSHHLSFNKIASSVVFVFVALGISFYFLGNQNKLLTLVAGTGTIKGITVKYGDGSIKVPTTITINGVGTRSTTAFNQNYSFSGLTSGVVYSISIVVPPGWTNPRFNYCKNATGNCHFDTVTNRVWNGTSVGLNVPAGGYYDLWWYFDPVSITNPQPKGNFDVANCTNIAGWTCDQTDFTKSLSVKIYDGLFTSGKAPVATGIANITREAGVGTTCGGGTPVHGFSIITPASLKNNIAHNLYAYSIDINSGIQATNALGGSPKSINCAPTVVQATPIVRKFPLSSRVISNESAFIKSNLTTGVLASPTKQVSLMLGTVVDGPVTQGGVVYWNINFDSGPDGWINESALHPKGFTSYELQTTISRAANAALSCTDKGDVDCNGAVTVTDGVTVLKCAAGSTTCNKSLADMDCSDTVTVTDGVNVLRKAAGLSVVGCAPTVKRNMHSIDFDGDGRSDYAIYRPRKALWYWRNYNTGEITSVQYGIPGDNPVPFDYNGDGKTDIAVWGIDAKTGYGRWAVSPMAVQGVEFGENGDIPVPGDYDGDRKGDFALWRPSNATWYIYNAAQVQFGQTGDIPVPYDYDGDGKTDYAVYRPSTRTYYIKDKPSRTFNGSQIGLIPMPGDYDGDGKGDYAVFIRANATTKINNTSVASTATGQSIGASFGNPLAIPVSGDYNKDGKTDFADWDPATGNWNYLGGGALVNFGASYVYEYENQAIPLYGGMLPRSVLDGIPQAPPIIETFSIDPTVMDVGRSAKLTWKAFAKDCRGTYRKDDGTYLFTNGPTLGTWDTQVFTYVANTWRFGYTLGCFGFGSDRTSNKYTNSNYVEKYAVVTVNAGGGGGGGGGGGTITPGSGTHAGTPRYIGVGTPYVPQTVTIHMNGLPSVLNNLRWRARIWPYGGANTKYLDSRELTGKGDVYFNVPPGKYDVTLVYFEPFFNDFTYIDLSSDFDVFRDVCSHCFDHPANSYVRNNAGEFTVDATNQFADVSVYVVPNGATIRDYSVPLQLSTIYPDAKKTIAGLFTYSLDSVKKLFNSAFWQEALAFSLLNEKWPACKTGPFYIAPSAQGMGLGVSLTNILLQGRQAWVNVNSKLSIGSFFNSSYDSQPDSFDNINTINLVPKTYFFYDPLNKNLRSMLGYAGYVLLRETNGGIIIETDILLNKDYIFSTPNGISTMQNIFTHEFGHVLGIAHDKSNPINVMFGSEGDPNLIQDAIKNQNLMTGGIMPLTDDDKIALVSNYNFCQ
ncbi:MAG: FG-GAP-like repeat-containing protein [bacterium]|nr:FG-GAP-like repeat-containing protein [bacterium]